MINFAQTATDSITTVTPDPVIDSSTTEPFTNAQASSSTDIAPGIFIATFVLAIINLAFFLTAIVHLIKNPAVPNRTLWVLVSIFVPFGSWIYVLGPRRTYSKHGSVGSQNPLQAAAFNQPQQQSTPIQQQPTPVAVSMPAPVAPSPPVEPVVPVAAPTVVQPAQPIAQPQQPVQQPPAQMPVFTPEQRQNTKTPQQFDQDFRSPNPAPQNDQQPNQTNQG